MAAAVQFELQGDGGNFQFDVEGGVEPSIVPEFKLASEPPQITGLRESWEIRGARLVTTDNAPGTVWAKFVALRARLATRGTAFPTAAYFKIPGGATLHTLGPATHEGFVVEVLSGGPDEANEGASWRSTITCTLRVSAVQRFADANGIVGWEQVVSSTYPDGRHLLEWKTRITTLEGTDAITKARLYAAIDASVLGTTYLYETGDGDGVVDVVSQDADTINNRVVTIVDVVSRVRAYGTTIGAVTPGASPVDVTYSIITRSTADETSTTYTATAQGPGAMAYVASKEPAVWNEREVHDEQAKMFASGTWTQRSKKETDPKLSIARSLSVTIAGGKRAIDFESVADGGEPVLFVGAYTAVVAVVEIEIESQGDSLKNSDMKLPGAPGPPWFFDPVASTEGEPKLKEAAASPDGDTWTRSARLVFRAAKIPPTPIGQSMLNASTVSSHFYA